MYILFVIGVAVWAVYGFLRSDPIVLASNIITFIFSSITLGFKISNVASGREPFFNSKKNVKNDSSIK